MRSIALGCAWATVGTIWLTGCATAPKTPEAKASLNTEAQAAVKVAKDTDPGLQKFFDTAAGYAVFPKVGKGAVGVGGAFGRGILYQRGQPVGYCSLTQATVGAALGGQSYTELVFLETPQAVERFKSGKLNFTAQVSAVALKSGASANARYADNVLVFTMDQSGLMAEASIGGQKFSFEPFAGAAPRTTSATTGS